MLPSEETTTSTVTVEVVDVRRRFGSKAALAGVSLKVARGQIHTLLGPNGAGKTTLLRIIAGLTAPTSGSVSVLDGNPADRSIRRHIGWLPAADRTFYLRISGFENLLFFGRLYGLRYKEAADLARKALHAVGLDDAADKRVGHYSHGMQKRLLMARASLSMPKVLIIDEATHDLDPRGAETIRAMIKERANKGAAIIWATQRIEEIRGFADSVTVLGDGETRFNGSVSKLISKAFVQSYILRVAPGGASIDAVNSKLVGQGRLETRSDEPGTLLLQLREGATIGEALAVVTASQLKITGCRESQSDLEQAFLAVTENNDE